MHPQPLHRFHAVIVPRTLLRSLADLHIEDPFLADLLPTVQGLVSEYHLKAYRLIVNGGDYQEFPHLHFHLVSDLIDQED